MIVPLEAKAGCSFRTAEYIKELSEPNLINRIKIKVPKSKSYIKNYLQILNSKTDAIPTELKRRFKANLEVIYPFGQCKYLATIWQNGDWKDHITYNYVSSINVRLENGNIMNSV